MASIYKPVYVKVDPRTGIKVKRRLRTWYIKYRDAQGVVRRVKGFTDKEATRQRAAELSRKAAREAIGIIDRFADHRQRLLVDHLKDFERFLAAKGNTPKHIESTGHMVRVLIKECRFHRTGDLSGARLQEWLAVHRRSGAAPRTCNAYLVGMKGFARWLTREGRMAENPLAHLSLLNARVDVRRERRALEPAQFSQFLAAAAADTSYRGMSGPDREVLYLVAAYTGLRAGELASLTPASFDLDAIPPTVTVEARSSKHRKRDVQPLHAGLVAKIRPWLAARPACEPIWERKALRDGALLVRHDLATAGIPYRDASGRVFDFHGLRHWFITRLTQSGCHPKALQILARHSTVALTLDKYAHLSPDDASRALAGLPRLVSGTPEAADGTSAEHVPQHVPVPGAEGRFLAAPDNARPSQPVQLAVVGNEEAVGGNDALSITNRPDCFRNVRPRGHLRRSAPPAVRGRTGTRPGGPAAELATTSRHHVGPRRRPSEAERLAGFDANEGKPLY